MVWSPFYLQLVELMRYSKVVRRRMDVGPAVLYDDDDLMDLGLTFLNFYTRFGAFCSAFWRHQFTNCMGLKWRPLHGLI